MARRSPSDLSEPAPPAAPRERRRQEDRTQETKRKAIDAAIEIIAEEGYAATTTSAVAERAGISRGGMLHHFPSKIDLIEAVVRDVETRLRATRRTAINRISDPVERFIGLTDATWETFAGNEILALTEIIMAMRGDAPLEERLAGTVAEMDLSNLDGTFKVAHRAGLTDDRLITAMHHLHYAAMRGLAIDRTLATDDNKIQDAFALLVWYKKILTLSALERLEGLPPLPTQG